MVGDRAHDVDGARVHDIDTIGVLWGYGTTEELTTAGAAVARRHTGRRGHHAVRAG